jgi:hypothetical protein
MTIPETPSPPRRRWRYFLITLVAFAVTVALFYAEEDWRGWRAMEQCKSELEAQGVSLDWSKRIPAPVPEDENVFGVSEMQEGFTGRGEKNLTKNWPARPNNLTRTVIAQLTIGLAGVTPPVGSAVLKWGDRKQGDLKAKEEVIRLIKEAIGPVAFDPVGPVYTKRLPGEIRAVQINLQCQNQLRESDLQWLVPDFLFKNQWDSNDKLKVERTSEGSYNVTMHTPVTAAEFLKSNEPLEPEFALIRKALQRPYARIDGDYGDPFSLPIPAFVTIRTISQRLAAMAECHLLLGQPEEALGDLTLMHDLCRRVLEENKPMTLVSAMINVAVRGLAAGIIADGLKMHAWRDPQLVVLERQLDQINLLGPVKQSFETEREELWQGLGSKSVAQLEKMFKITDLVVSVPAKGHGKAKP